MRLLCAYYKLDRLGYSLARERSQEHIALYDGITGKCRPLCGYAMDTEKYTWKEISGKPKYLCLDCQREYDPIAADREALKAWNAGEPIR